MTMNKVTGMSTDDFSKVGLVEATPESQAHDAALAVAGRVERGLVAKDEVKGFLEMLGVLEPELARCRAKAAQTERQA